MTELPEGWVEDAAGELCQVVGGATPRTDTDSYWGGDVPWITPDDLSRDRRKFVEGGRRSITREGLDSCAATLVPAGTVLFTSRAPIGYTAIASRPIATNQGFKSLIPSDGLQSDFVYWQLVHLTETIRGMGSGTTFAEVSKKVMATVPLRVAPLAEQHRIVAAIEEASSKLDAGEAGLRTVRQLLKRMRDAILAAAVTGRLVPQDPTDTPATKLLADLGIEALDKGDLDDLPNGWARVAIGDLAEITSGPAFKSAQFKGPGEGIRLLRGENIEPGALRWRDTRTWPDDLLPGHEHLLVAASDLILAMDRPVISAGLKLAPVRVGDLPALLVQRVARVRPKADEVRPFLLVTMQHSRFVAHLLGGQVGTQLPHITLKGIREYSVGVPGREEMERIVTEVERQMSFVEACERAVDAGLERSTALRRSVLKAAFEGRLVPQDPTDEPASVLLERIRAERAAAPKAKSLRAKANS